MITRLKLTNFKCFQTQAFDLGGATVLVGTNGAGKSTVVQSLLAIRQSWETGSLDRGRIELNGSLTQLGTAGEIYCADPNSDSLEIEITSSADHTLLFSSKQTEMNADEYLLNLSAPPTPNGFGIEPFGIFSDPFNYLHAERLGPRKIFDVQTRGEHPLSVGTHGEFAAFIATTSAYKDRNVANHFLLLESDDGNEYATLKYQWPLWMAKIFPGFDVDASLESKSDQVRLGLALQRGPAGQNLFFRPTNTGFGISFALGIVVAALVAEPQSLLVVENPEAHLHPRAQSAIGELLARTASGGTQVVIETHSEHVVNGFRRMVKQGVLPAADIRLYYFGRRPERIAPDVVPIGVGSDGSLSEWPAGFFDQLDKDLDIILG